MDDDIKREDLLFDLDEGDEAEELNFPPKRSRLVFKIISALLLLAFVAFSYPDISAIWSDKLSFLEQNSTLAGDEIVKECKPAVVNIQARDTGSVTGSSVKGTGFNLAPDGFVITNRHVVKGASQVQVTFSDGSSYYSREIQTLDSFDVAIIKLHGRDLPILKAVFDQTVQSGQTVTVIGNPLGYERISTRGKVGDFYNGGDAGAVIFDIAVTVEHGSSGSPVLNEKGQVVGIIFGTTTINIEGQQKTRALAIPINEIKQFIKKV
jgi:S1-C subfamily serine protease